MPQNTDNKPPDSQPDLFRRTVKGGFWVIASRITLQLLAVVRLIIIANLLTPSDFGIFGIALLTLATVSTFTQTGFQSALIQKKESPAEYLDSVWTIGIIRGALIFTVIFFAAPYVAVFCDGDQSIPLDQDLVIKIIRLLSFNILLGSFNNIGGIFFTKDLQFHKHFISKTGATLVNYLVTIILVVTYRSIWSLVWGKMAGTVTSLIISYAIHPYRPQFRFDIVKMKELWGFGRWLFGFNIVFFIINKSNDFLIIKLLGTTSLGIYQMALNLARLPLSEIGSTIHTVSFPALSKLQDDFNRLKNAFLKTIRMLVSLVYPLSSLLIVLAVDFINLFLSDKWQSTIPIIQFLAVMGFIGAPFTNSGALFQALGKPKYVFLCLTIRSIIMLSMIYPLVHYYGLAGACGALIFPAILVKFVTLPLLIKTLRISLIEFTAQIIPPTAASVIMIVLLLTLKHTLFTQINLYSFAFLALTGIAVYILVLCLISPKTPREFISLVQNMLTKST